MAFSILKTLNKLCDWCDFAYGSVLCFYSMDSCPGARFDSKSDNACYPYDLWAGSDTMFQLCSGNAFTRVATPDYAISARCVRYLIKMCLLYRVNFKKLCDNNSSDLGSIMCLMGYPLCLGTPNNNKCGPQDYLTGNLHGTNVWYYTLSRGKFAQHNTLSMKEAFSARCVRYLIKMCLLYRVNFKKTL